MIKTVMFDFAGVITKSAMFSRVAGVFGERENIGTVDFLRRLKSEEKDYVLGEMKTKEYWKRVCKGTKIGYDEFVDEISRYELNDEVISLVRKIGKMNKAVLISDNYDALYRKMSRDPRLRDLFNHAFYSHKLHMVKMYDGEKVFLFVLDKLKVDAKECVFIDDKEMNLAPAKRIGMNTVHFKDGAQLEKELRKLNVMF